MSKSTRRAELIFDSPLLKTNNEPGYLLKGTKSRARNAYKDDIRDWLEARDPKQYRWNRIGAKNLR